VLFGTFVLKKFDATSAPRFQKSITHSSTCACLFQAWYAYNDAWMTDSDRGKLNLIAELLSIKHHYCSLELFIADEVDAAIEFLCTT